MENDKIFIYWKNECLGKFSANLFRRYDSLQNISSNDIITEIASSEDKILDYLFNKYGYAIVKYIKNYISKK